MEFIRPLEIVKNEMKTNLLISGLVKINGYEMELTESEDGGLVQLFRDGFQEVFVKKNLITALETAIQRTEVLNDEKR